MMYDVIKFTYTVHTLHTLKQPFATFAVVFIAISGSGKSSSKSTVYNSTDKAKQHNEIVASTSGRWYNNGASIRIDY